MPEWYFLPFYAILRAVPNKLMGVLAMFGAIGMLFVLPWLDTSKVRSMRYRPTARLYFFIFVAGLHRAGLLRRPRAGRPGDPGRLPASQLLDSDLNSFVWLSRIAALYYFAYFLVITPLLGLTETPLPVPESISDAGPVASRRRARRRRGVA